MKNRFNTFDIVCVVTELQSLIGMRVNNVYDIDNRTFLIRFQKGEEKRVLLFESGNRIHTTNFEWPKNVAPSGFSMKLRKHLKNKRIETICQLGTDRIVNMQFGTGEAAYHVILELYDRGNIILTDYEMTILYLLRPHTEADRVKFAVREKYPENRAREIDQISKAHILEILQNAKAGDPVKKVLVSKLDYGPALLEHVLKNKGFSNASKIGKTFDILKDIDTLYESIMEANTIFENAKQQVSKGYIIQKKEERPGVEDDKNEIFYSNQEFHPMLFSQHNSQPYKEFDTFCVAIDEFFSNLESQKLEMKAFQQEKDAVKKLENVKKDHHQRLKALADLQEVDKQKAELITRNQELVDKCIYSIQSFLANQISWEDIDELRKDAAQRKDPVASCIQKLKLEMNHISLFLTDPYAESGGDSEGENNDIIPSMTVDVDLDLTAFANARRYYDKKRNAAKKQQKTIESQHKALKSAEKKTKQTLKEVQIITNINKVRKFYWFEKFYWFISSENYLIIAGRDQQQNELIVKRYMKPTDIYVHADIHGASSVVIKNPSGQPVPPKTLNEAGTMAICYSVAWEAKVVTSAYWVKGDQVSKTAPTGEYLTTGSFMIRGKKNFLPPAHLVLGLSFLFRLEDSFIEKHLGERKVTAHEDTIPEEEGETVVEDVEVPILDESDEDEANRIENELAESSNGSKNNEIEETNTKNCSDDENKLKFPDTQVKFNNFKGTSMLMDDKIDLNHHLNSRKSSSLTKNKKSDVDKEKVERNEQQANNTKQSTKQNQTKRGQKGKLKKIKEKYKDQDEEERRMIMEILKSSGNQKESKKSKRDQHGKNNKHQPKVPQIHQPRAQNENDAADNDEEPVVQADVDMIDALTGIPFEDDELLFAVPVIAPYNTLANYKFKVKLTPGTSRRGKASKTAIAMFLKDRSITSREKDLLKAVKDDQLARNIPGKVKLSAPKLQILKK